MADILVVTDVSWVVNDVRSALTDGRFTVTTEADPRRAPNVVVETEPVVVLVDLQVGTMGGMAITRAIRDAAAVEGTYRPPIVMLLDRDADSFLAGRSGAEAWLRKPFSADALRATIDGLLAGAQDQQ